MEKKMIIIGHRGAPNHAPENTLKSFRKAIELGVDMIELDTKITKDRKLVIMHDATLNRTTNGSGLVHEKTLSELKQLNAGEEEKIPTFEEALACINRKTKVMIDMHIEPIAQEIANTINHFVKNKNWSYDDFYVVGFDHHELKKFKSILPHVKISAAFIGVPYNLADYILEMQSDSITLITEVISDKIVSDAHSKGINIFVASMDPQERMLESLKNYNIDGIITNYSERARILSE